LIESPLLEVETFDLTDLRLAAEARKRGLATWNLGMTALLAALALGILPWKGVEIFSHGLESYQVAALLAVEGSLALFAAMFGATWYSKLPGGQVLRVGSESVDVIYGPKDVESFSWAASGQRFRIIDFTKVNGRGRHLVSSYKLQGVHFWSRTTQLSERAATAIFEVAKQRRVNIQTHPPSAWDLAPGGLLLHEFMLGQTASN
jgi:hypothetical protein